VRARPNVGRAHSRGHLLRDHRAPQIAETLRPHSTAARLAIARRHHRFRQLDSSSGRGPLASPESHRTHRRAHHPASKAAWARSSPSPSRCPNNISCAPPLISRLILLAAAADVPATAVAIPRRPDLIILHAVRSGESAIQRGSCSLTWTLSKRSRPAAASRKAGSRPTMF
jgi:hypothetical protein